MNHRVLSTIVVAATAALFAVSSQADNIADCEILLMEFIEDEKGNGGMQVASYGPAEDYIASVYDDEPGHLKTVDDAPIRALLCQRNNVIPAESDYALLATGIPFILSQDFDDTETDSLTLFWKRDHFGYVYKGYPMTDETEALLETRLADFTTRDHGLVALAPKQTDEMNDAAESEE